MLQAKSRLGIGVCLLTTLIVSMDASAQRKRPGAVMEYRNELREAGQNPKKTIPIHLKYALAMAEQAVKDKNPNMFGKSTGITQAMDAAARELETLTKKKGADNAAVTSLTAQYNQTSEVIAKHEASFNEDRLASTKAPENNYKGEDKAKLESMIREAWKQAYPDDEVLGVHFPNADWKRESNRKWSDAENQWYVVDTSILMVKFVVKKDGNTASIFPAYINRDNLSGELNTGVHTKKGGYVIEEILLKNYK